MADFNLLIVEGGGNTRSGRRLDRHRTEYFVIDPDDPDTTIDHFIDHNFEATGVATYGQEVFVGSEREESRPFSTPDDVGYLQIAQFTPNITLHTYRRAGGGLQTRRYTVLAVIGNEIYAAFGGGFFVLNPALEITRTIVRISGDFSSSRLISENNKLYTLTFVRVGSRRTIEYVLREVSTVDGSVSDDIYKIVATNNETVQDYFSYAGRYFAIINNNLYELFYDVGNVLTSRVFLRRFRNNIYTGTTSLTVVPSVNPKSNLARFSIAWDPSGLAIATTSRLARFNIPWRPGTIPLPTTNRLARFNILWSAPPPPAPVPQPTTQRLARFDITWQPLPAPTTKRLARFNIAWQPIPIPTTTRLARFAITWFPVNISLPNPNTVRLARFPIEWMPLTGTPTTPVTPALHKIEFRKYGEILWRDATPQLANEGKITQGREFSTLGGGNPRSSPLSLRANFTEPAPEPGDECRVIIKERVHFQGHLTEIHEIQTGIHSTTWLGPMWGITSDHRTTDPRLYIQNTPDEILASMGRIHRTPVYSGRTLRRYTREIPWGADGLDTLEELTGGVVYDTPQFVNLEYPQERMGLPVIRKLTDIQNKAADEFEIPTPRKHENAFGVLNHVEVVLRVRQPKEGAPRVKDIRIPRRSISIPRHSNTEVEFDIPNQDIFVHPDTPLIYSWDVNFIVVGTDNNEYTLLNLVGSFGPSVNNGRSGINTVTAQNQAGDKFSLTISVNEFNVTARGNIVTVSFNYSAIVDPIRRVFFTDDIEVSGTLKIVSAIPLEQVVTDFTKDVTIESSIDRYKLRSRGSPIILTVLERTLTVPPVITDAAEDELVRVGLNYLNRHREPIPVYEVVTPDIRIIDSRGISHREHLRLKNGTDGDFFVERIETQIYPLLQTAYLVDEAHAIGTRQLQ